MALLDEAPTLTAKLARGKRMTKTRKVIAGVPFRLAHAGSSAALKSDPAALALVDEYDEMIANVNGQGDPLGLVERRGDTYADFVCVVTSTCRRGMVGNENDEKSGLHVLGRAQSRRHRVADLAAMAARHAASLGVAVSALRRLFRPALRLPALPLDATPTAAARETWLECPRCGGVIEDKHKADMNARGRYVAPGQGIDADGTVHGEPPDTAAISFWVSGSRIAVRDLRRARAGLCRSSRHGRRRHGADRGQRRLRRAVFAGRVAI